MIALNNPVIARLEHVEDALTADPVPAKDMCRELRNLAADLAECFKLNQKDLWQYAAAVSVVESSEICREHLQEAAQLLLIRNGK